MNDDLRRWRVPTIMTCAACLLVLTFVHRPPTTGYRPPAPAGGNSNTWEWEETLYFPISGKPVVRYMWSIGHTIRPNCEILEGNPALVDEYVPVTRDNYLRYYPTLIERALTHFGLQ